MGPRVAEFFAGMGLVRRAMDAEGFTTIFANDVDEMKEALYLDNFGPGEFLLGDIAELAGSDVPSVDVASASFPCTDLSLAGNRHGLAGPESGLFWEFVRVIGEMENRPAVILIENVLGFASSDGGEDLRSVVRELNHLGYWCDVIVVDAAWFVPQSRQRLFIVASKTRTGEPMSWQSALRPTPVVRALSAVPDLKLQETGPLPDIHEIRGLESVVETLPPSDERWWTGERRRRFLTEMSPMQSDRLHNLIKGPSVQWRTAYRRTRNGSTVWEVRADNMSGALRTARGGSSKQALVEAGDGDVKVRWMTPTEYARLQGAGDARLDAVTTAQALYALGDAVCVPAVSWIARTHVLPLLSERPLSARTA